jgi:hypothetical protein
VATNKLVVNATTGAVTGPNTGAFSLDNGNASAINIGGTTATTVNIGRSGQTQALLGNVTVAGTVTGPAAAAFTIDAGGANTIDIGGTTATTLNLGRSGQTQALLGNGTVAGTLNVGSTFTVATNKLTVNAGTGAVTGPNAGAFSLDNGNASAINIGGTTATTLNLGRTGQTQALLGNVTVAGTLTVGAAGNAVTEIKRGTCAIANTAIVKATTTSTTCTITGGNQDLTAFQVSVSPQANPPAGIQYIVGAPTTTAIVLLWDNGTNANVNSGIITFNWTAVR